MDNLYTPEISSTVCIYMVEVFLFYVSISDFG